MKSAIHFFCIFSYPSRIFSYVFCEFHFGDSLSLFYANFFISFPPFCFPVPVKREREICPGWMKQETMSQRFSSGKFAKRIKRQKGWSWLFLFETLSRIVFCFRFFKTRLCSTPNKSAFNCCVNTFRVLWLLMNCNECPSPLPAAAVAGLSTTGFAEIDDKVYYSVSNIIWR